MSDNSVMMQMKSQDALRESEEKYRLLFENMNEGFSLCEVIYDNDGNPFDFRFLEINKAYEMHTGLKAVDIIGRTLLEIAPDIEPSWINMLAKVSTTGEPARTEDYNRSIKRFYETFAFSPKKGEVALLLNDISGRRQIEDELRKSEEKLRTVIENTRDGINMFDLKTGRYVLMSPTQPELTGFTAEELNNLSAEEAYGRTHPDDREIIVNRQKMVAEGLETTSTVEYRWRVKSGEYRWFSDSRKLVRGADGCPVAMVGVSSDITERKMAEEALYRTQIQLEEELVDSQLLQSLSSEFLLEDNIQALYEKIIDAATKIMHSEYASMQMFCPEPNDGGKLRLLACHGFNPEAVKFWEHVRISSNSACAEALRTGKRVIIPDVEKCDYLRGTEDLAMYLHTGIHACQTTPLYSRSGKLVGMISTHWQYPCQPSERDLRLWDILARQAADMIERKTAEEYITKQNTILQAINQVYEKAMNCGTVEELGEICLDIIESATLSKFSFIGEIGGDGLFHDIAVSDPGWKQCPVPDKPGRPVPPRNFSVTGLYENVLLNGRSLLTNDPASYPEGFGVHRGHPLLTAFLGVPIIHRGKIEGIIGVGNREGGYGGEDQEILEALAPTVHEVLMRKKQQELLIRAEQERNEILLKSIEMKDEFLTLVSHEFKTPLTVINSAVQAMRLICRDELSDKANKYLSKILQNSNRQLKLVNNLLDITRINAGRIKINPANIDIIAVTRTITESIMVFAEQKGIRLSFSSTLGGKIIGIDVEKYERILLNLLSNAIKYTPRGKSISVRASQKVVRGKCKVCIQVKDQGIGIPQDKQQLIFERFGQVDSSLSRQAEGTGIGLSLVKMFVEIMGGEIAVESAVGKGSTFTVLFPVIKINETPIEKMLQEINDNRLIQATALEFSDIY